jgi:hypothetical protein
MIGGRRLWRAWYGPLFLVLAVASFCPPSFAGGGRLVAEVGEPFLVGAETVPPGTLSVRHVNRLSPVSSLDEVWVDDRCLGVLLASRSRSEGGKAPDSLVFTRNAQGRLVLAGYYLRSGRNTDLYRFALESPAEIAGAKTAGPLTVQAR